MNILFRGRPVTWDRLRWWIIILLTYLFGRRLDIDGRPGETVRILPIIHNKHLYLLGAQKVDIQPFFVSQHKLALRRDSVVSIENKASVSNSPRSIVHTVLCHQEPGLVTRILDHHRKLGPRYRLMLAYGGDRTSYERIDFEHKFFVEDPSLRGAAHFMQHYEMIEKTLGMMGEDEEHTTFFFSESDVLPLRGDYLQPAFSMFASYDADFAAKLVRDVSASSNGFLARAVSQGIVGPRSKSKELWYLPCYHALGCFFALNGRIARRFLTECRRLRGMYFEVMFPTAAAAAGGRILSFDLHSDYLESVVYRPFFDRAAIQQLMEGEAYLAHPVKRDVLDWALSQSWVVN